VSAWVVVLLMLGPIFVVVAVVRNQKRVSTLRSATVELRVDAMGVRRVLADGREEGVDWLDVTEIEVLTTNSGPYAASGGVIIVAGDEEHGCLVPIDQLQTSGLAEALTYLPGFDMRRLLAAVTVEPPDPGQWNILDAVRTTPPARTTCWTRPSTGLA